MFEDEMKECIVVINDDNEMEMDFEEIAEVVDYDDEILSLLNQLQRKECKSVFFNYNDDIYKVTLL